MLLNAQTLVHIHIRTTPPCTTSNSMGRKGATRLEDTKARLPYPYIIHNTTNRIDDFQLPLGHPKQPMSKTHCLRLTGSLWQTWLRQALNLHMYAFAYEAVTSPLFELSSKLAVNVRWSWRINELDWTRVDANSVTAISLLYVPSHMRSMLCNNATSNPYYSYGCLKNTTFLADYSPVRIQTYGIEVQSCNEVRPFGCLNYCKFESARQSFVFTNNFVK